MNHNYSMPYYTPNANHDFEEFAFMRGATVLVDRWCFCRYRAVKVFLDRITPFLSQHRMQLCLAKSAQSDIRRQMADPSTEPSYRRSLQSGLEIIRALDEAGMIRYLGAESESTERIFLTHILYNRESNIVVLTQQKWLYDDVLQFNALRTVRGNEVQIRRLDNDGCLACFVDSPQPAFAPAPAAAHGRYEAERREKKTPQPAIDGVLMRLGLV